MLKLKMTCLNCFFLFLFILTSSLIAQPIDGLVAYYPFNGNANDESENVNDGMISGSVLTDDRKGNTNSAYYFDGSNDFINCGNSDQLNISGPNSSITMSTWIYPKSIKERRDIISMGRDYTSNKGYHLEIENEKVKVIYRLESGDNIVLYSPNKLVPNQWYHIATSYDGIKATLYINGILESYFNKAGYIGRATTNFIIGCHSPFPPTWYPFYGKIDDIRIYDRALTLEEIKALYGDYNPNEEKIAQQLKVIDVYGNPVVNASVFTFSSFQLLPKISKTNENGYANIKTLTPPLFIIAASNNSLGFGGIDSKHIPVKLYSTKDAGFIFDNLLNIMSKIYGYASSAHYIATAMNLSPVPKMGAPGIFSINPIPRKGKQGRLEISISGILATQLLKSYFGSMNKVNGANATYILGDGSM